MKSVSFTTHISATIHQLHNKKKKNKLKCDQKIVHVSITLYTTTEGSCRYYYHIAVTQRSHDRTMSERIN